MIRALILALSLIGAASHAQAPPSVTLQVGPDVAIEDVARVIDAARRSGATVVLQLGAARPAPAQAAAPPAAGERGLGDLVVAGLGMRAPTIDRMFTLPEMFATRLQARLGGIVGALSLLAIVLAAAAVAGAAARRLGLALLAARGVVDAASLIDRTRRAGLVFLAELAGIGAMWGVGTILTRVLASEGDPVRAFAAAILGAAWTAWLYLAVGRGLIAPAAPHDALIRFGNPSRVYRWYSIYAVANPALIELLNLSFALGARDPELLPFGLLVATVATIFKVVWFWSIRGDVRTALAGAEAPSLPVRIFAATWHLIFIAVALAIWVIFVIAPVLSEGRGFAASAGQTQILLAAIPILAAGCGALMREWLERGTDHGPTARAVRQISVQLGIGAIWLGGLVAIARVWSVDVLAPANATVAGVIRVVAVAIGVVVIAWIGWTLVRAAFDAAAGTPRKAAAPGEDDDAATPASRLATIVPIVRNLVLGVVAGVAALIILSTLGVDISPLLAGAGVLGLALSFGSQALVRDIVSGIFFLADDAFRVGEYIDTGRLKGTVERISLRSVILRHQNGQLHTIPFGQLQSISNFSRDWATVKFNIRLDRSVDVEAVRKTVKKIGQEMMADPELAKEFIQPLKLQGIGEIADSALVCRFKFTAKPDKPSVLQREAMKRIYRGFQEKGIRFASNAVMVQTAGSVESAGAAVAAQPAPGAAATPAAT